MFMIAMIHGLFHSRLKTPLFSKSFPPWPSMISLARACLMSLTLTTRWQSLAVGVAC